MTSRRGSAGGFGPLAGLPLAEREPEVVQAPDHFDSVNLSRDGLRRVGGAPARGPRRVVADRRRAVKGKLVGKNKSFRRPRSIEMRARKSF